MLGSSLVRLVALQSQDLDGSYQTPHPSQQPTWARKLTTENPSFPHQKFLVEDSLSYYFQESSKTSSQQEAISLGCFTDGCLEISVVALDCHYDWNVPLALSVHILGMLNVLQ